MKTMKTIRELSMMLLAFVATFCMTACSSSDDDGGGNDLGGGSAQQESIIGEWVGFVSDDEIEVVNIKAGGQMTATVYWKSSGEYSSGWFYDVLTFTYTVKGNQLTAIASNGETKTFSFSITTSKDGTYLTLISDGQSGVYSKMTNKIRAQIQAMNATEYKEPTSEPLTGDWYLHFQSSKGEGYSILSFKTDGSGRYIEYDNGSGKLVTTDEKFTYTYMNGQWLLIAWNKGGSEKFEVISYNSTSLVLKGWPDKGNNYFRPLTYEVSLQIEAFKTLNSARKKVWIYGEYPVLEPPFKPAAWDAAAMRFSTTEGEHFPTLSDDVYFGHKTLIIEVSDASSDCKARVMNGWWSPIYEEEVTITNGLWKIPITEQMANDCAKGAGGRDLDLMLVYGSCTINSVYYEE